MLLLLSQAFGVPPLYLDPGSGSFLIQLILAAALGIGVAAKMYWTKLKGLFINKKEPGPITDDDDETL